MLLMISDNQFLQEQNNSTIKMLDAVWSFLQNSYIFRFQNTYDINANYICKKQHK